MKKQTKRKKFNWLTTLKKAIKHEPTSKEFKRLFRRSSDWPTCACGQLCRALPRDEDGQPRDALLSALGMDFHADIRDRRWCLALETFEEIERRSTELLKRLKHEI